MSLHIRTATLGVASGCVCDHVREAPFAASGRRGDRRRVVLLQAAEARRLLSAHLQRRHHLHSCSCCRRKRHTHCHRLLTITTPHVTPTPPHIRLPALCRERGRIALSVARLLRRQESTTNKPSATAAPPCAHLAESNLVMVMITDELRGRE